MIHDLNSILTQWCDENLTSDRTWKGQTVKLDKMNETLIKNMNGKLLYFDGTACSASHAISNIYQLCDNTFIVCTDLSGTLLSHKCKNIIYVIDHLLEFCFHDCNSTGDLFKYLLHNYQIDLDNDMKEKFKNSTIPILSKCDPNNEELISAINMSMDIWKTKWFNK